MSGVMSQPYGPALLLGIIIGGAILLDDDLAPSLPQPSLPHGADAAPTEHRDVSVFVVKKDDTAAASETEQEIDIVLEADGTGGADGEHVSIHVKAATADGVDLTPAALDQALEAVIATARAENRAPTEAEIINAVNRAVAGPGGELGGEVEIAIETDGK